HAMPIEIQGTPNPNALKFSVGVPVGGPTTVVPGKPSDDPTANAIAEIEGVTSVFMTADFVTLTKTPEADWQAIVDIAHPLLANRFGD
ncbi:MAG: scaffolding protein, partial [Acidimicrobiia bacterium]|nr:scaffolding protein [Acidimicrobiia bacterium]